jgi:hypothetical protein
MLAYLYGLSIDLPPGWRDLTEYCFEAPDSLLTKLVFAWQALSPEQVEPWLQEIRDKIADLDLSAGPIVDYANPTLRIRGFDAVRDANGERDGTSFIVVSFPEHAVVIQPKWRDGGEPLVKDLVRSLRPRSAGAPLAPLDPTKRCYTALGLLFDTSIGFAEPYAFAFESADGRGRLWCSGRPREPAFEEPIWTARFDIGLEPSLTPNVIRSGRVVSQHVVAPELSGPIFEQASWTTTAVVDAKNRALAWAEARTELDGQPFRIWLAYEGDEQEALAVWMSLLTSARRQ